MQFPWARIYILAQGDEESLQLYVRHRKDLTLISSKTMSGNRILIACPECISTSRSLPGHLRERCLKGHSDDDIVRKTNGQRNLACQFSAGSWVVDADDVREFINDRLDFGMQEMLMGYLAKLGHLIPPAPVHPARSWKQRKAARAVDREHANNHRVRTLSGEKARQPDASPPKVTLDSLRPRAVGIVSAGSCHEGPTIFRQVPCGCSTADPPAAVHHRGGHHFCGLDP